MARQPFVVHIGAIAGSIGLRMEVDRRAPLGELTTSGSSVPPDADVGFTGVLERVEGGVVAVGTVDAKWIGECRRCLGRASGQIVSEVREIFETSPTEGETYPLGSDTVDLEPLIREAVMLDLPTAPACRADCAGLCPTCGVNRNDNACDCSDEPGDPRWAVLDALKNEE